jgi:hypothetical protein
MGGRAVDRDGIVKGPSPERDLESQDSERRFGGGRSLRIQGTMLRGRALLVF